MKRRENYHSITKEIQKNLFFQRWTFSPVNWVAHRIPQIATVLYSDSFSIDRRVLHFVGATRGKEGAG